jgi:LmbE family N-acetylglucosaminyl deacetylase
MRNRSSQKSKVLVVAAHPDDEVLGCGGTIARLARSGHSVFVLILGEGVTSRSDRRSRKNSLKEIRELRKAAGISAKVLGVEEVFFQDFPDNRFDSVDLLDIVKAVEKVKNAVNPEVVFTHFEHDLNKDHRITNHAVLIATRPVKGETVKEVYAFEVASSTEWAFPLRFSPNVFFDISDSIGTKQKALGAYSSELGGSGHPRSLEGVSVFARAWGIRSGMEYAEPFICLRKMI